MSKLKIAIIAPFPPLIGGMVQLAETLSDNFEKDGHKVFRLQLGAGRAGIFPFPFLFFQYIWYIPRIDYIINVSASGNALWCKDLPAILITRLFRKKAILYFVGGKAIDSFAGWSWFKKLPFHLANSIVVPAKLFKALLENNRVKTKILVIPHTVEVEPFQRKSNRKDEVEPTLLAAKALEVYSGFDLMLDVFALVKEKIPKIQFIIAGSGPEEKKLRKKVQAMNIADVTFLGEVAHDRMADIMHQSTVFIHGSKYESFGIVLVEAMASGLPVVAFNIGGIPEVVDNNVTGYLVDYGDINTFAMKIIKLIENQEKKQEFSTKAIERSELFSWKNLKEDWYDIYHKS